MTTRNVLGPALLWTSVLTVALSIAAACSPTRPAAPENDAQMTTGGSFRRDMPDPRARLRAHNPFAWVGDEHNKALHEFRREVRKPGVFSRTACTYLTRFVLAPERLPAERRSSRDHLGAAASAGLNVSGLCRGQAASPFALPTGIAPAQDLVLSPNATQRANEVLSAIDNASTAADLATRLDAVVVAAAVLPEIEFAVVAAAASTAQSSFEYWEAELPAAQQELRDEYGACVEAQQASGVEEADAFRACVNGDMAVSRAPSGGGAQAIVRHAATHTMPECGLANNYRKLAKSDAIGAIVGGVKAAWLGPPGIGTGAFTGGALASLGQFVSSTWDLFWCAM